MNKLVVPATMDDVAGIFQLVTYYQKKQLVLQRSVDDITHNIQNFVVCHFQEDEKSVNKVVGCSSFHIYTPQLVEIRTICVAEEFKGKGIGRSLLNFQIDLARQLKVQRLFTLTKECAFFEKLDFMLVPKESLPDKIFKDCISCQQQENCFEQAMVLSLY